MELIEGKLKADGLKVAIISSRFNDLITQQLIAGAKDCFVRHGGEEKDLTHYRVPGAYELPLLCKKVAELKKYDAIVTLGAVIRGDTPHFDMVANETNKGIASISLEYSTPISFGVLTTDSIEQAIERAGTKAGNNGANAMISAIEMANICKQLS